MTLAQAGVWLLLGLAAMAIWAHERIGRLAYQAAQRHCQEQGVALLDQTIVLKKMRMRFSHKTLFAIERQYSFEFATLGDKRYHGAVTFVGQNLVHKSMQAFKEDASTETLH